MSTTCRTQGGKMVKPVLCVFEPVEPGVLFLGKTQQTDQESWLSGG